MINFQYKLNVLKKIKVVAAIICHEEKILCVQRGPSKFEYIHHKYEFPGGKVEEGESNEDALIREINEELSMNIENLNFLLQVEHQYPDFHITMDCYQCQVKTKDLTLTEHIAFKWLSKNELENLDWAAADLPIVKEIKGRKQ